MVCDKGWCGNNPTDHTHQGENIYFSPKITDENQKLNENRGGCKRKKADPKDGDFVVITAQEGTIQNFNFRHLKFLSDRSKKENIKPIGDRDYVGNLNKVELVSFDWKDTKQSDEGVIAQQVAESDPNVRFILSI